MTVAGLWLAPAGNPYGRRVGRACLARAG
jgi:hypothetical protein